MTPAPASIRWAPPLAHHPVGRSSRILVVVLAVVAWCASAFLGATLPAWYPTWFTVAALGSLAVALGVGLTQLRRPEGPVAGARLLTLVAIAVRCGEVLVGSPPPGALGNEPLTHVVTTGAAVVGIVYSTPVALPLVAVFGIATVLQRSEQVGAVHGAAEGAIILAVCLGPVLAASGIGRDLARLEQEAAAARRERVVAAVARARAQLQEQWDGLVHDRILAALRLAAEGDAAAAPFARLSLTELATTAPRASGDSTRLARLGTLLGLRLDVRVSEWPDGPIGAAVESATGEALSNVARHSGTDRARVAAVRVPTGWRVEISDVGRGFDAARAAEGRFGIARRLHAPLEAVGGSARVTSAPGAGTTVVLHAPAAVPVEEPVRPAWDPLSLARVAAVVALAVVSHCVIGSLYLWTAHLPWVAWAGILVIPVLVAVVMVLPAPSRAWPAVLVAATLLWGALVANVVHPEIADWRVWFMGPLGAFAGIVALRRGAAPALAVVGSVVVLGLVTWSGRDDAAIVPLFSASFQCVAWVLVAGYLRRLVDDASAQIGEEVRLRARAEAQTAAAHLRERETHRRLTALDDEVVPYLEQIASGADLDAEQRARCTELEATTRDLLLAGALVSADLGRAVLAARRRGAGVVVTCNGDVQEEPAERVRLVAVALLAAAGRRDKVRIAWRPDPRGRVCALTLVGAGAAGVDVPELPRVEADLDEDSVLVEVYA